MKLFIFTIEVYYFLKKTTIRDLLKLSIKNNEFKNGIISKDGTVIMGIRPEDIHDNLFAEIKDNANIVSAKVELVENMGSHKVVHFKTGDCDFSAELRNFNEDNQVVDLIFDMNKSHFFHSENGGAIQ